VNREISFRAHKIKKVSLLHKSLLKDISQEYASNIKLNLEEFSRNKNSQVLTKWINFKKNREGAVDKFITARKNILKAKKVVTLETLVKIIRKSWNNVIEYKIEKERLKTILYSSLKIIIKFKAQLRRYGPKKIDGKKLGMIKSTFALFGNIAARESKEKTGALY
jgi:hypothetical protein